MAETEPARCVKSGEIKELCEALKVITDVNRLRIICLLFSGEKCVCDIEERLEISQPLASHHLAVLRGAGLLEARRQGTWSYYSLVRENMEKLNRLFAEVLGTHKFPSHYPSREECEEIS